MATNRVTTTGVEVLRDTAAANNRVSSTGVEVLRNASAANVRVSSTGAEVLRNASAANVLVSALGVEVLRSVATGVPRTKWYPFPTTFAGVGDSSAFIDTILTPPTASYPALQIDMGEPMTLAYFAFITEGPATLPASVLYGSNNPSTSTTTTLQSGDVKLGTYSQADMNSGNMSKTTLAVTGEKYRYYRWVYNKDAGTGGASTAPDGTGVIEFMSSTSTAILYNNADYDSIYGKGDRVANGLFSTSEGGLGSVVAAFSTGFNNNYGLAAGDGPAFGGGALTAGTGYCSFDLGSRAVVLKGIAWHGQSNIVVDPGTPVQWAIYGGIDHASPKVRQHSYTSFNISLTNTGHEYFQEVLCGDAAVNTPFPYFELQLASSGSYLISRIANELWVKVDHSTLDGGDRRNIGGLTPTKAVIVTSDLTPAHGTLSTLVDGQVQSANRDSFFDPTDYVTFAATSTAGHYIQFQFPRPVSMHEMVLNAETQEVYSAGLATRYGRWQWQGSADNVTWSNVGPVWQFKDACNFMLAPDPQPNSNAAQYQLWRMVLVTGPAFDTAFRLWEFIFNLVDPGGLYTNLITSFTDDNSLSVAVTTTPPGTYTVVSFSDNIDDALHVTVTLTQNPPLSVLFTDEGDLEMFSDAFPSVVPQVMLHTTGR